MLPEIYKSILKTYRAYMPPVHTRPLHRKWMLEEYPHLDRGIQWNRALYDMNVSSWQSTSTTGICLSVALFVKETIEKRTGEESHLIGLFHDNNGEYESFHHCALQYKDNYYDVFYPEGVDDLQKILYADVCKVKREPADEVRSYLSIGPVELLNKNLYSKIKVD